jgi:predicted HNH restriction endonuclease
VKIEIIENIVSMLPLYMIKDDQVIRNPNTEKRRIVTKVFEAGAKRKIEKPIVQDGFQEGGVDEVSAEIKRQKRNPKLREEAIRTYGYNCVVCNFSFEDTYGDLGMGYIEVHHLELLSANKSERTLTANDVTVVCANCHRVLHRNGKELMSIEELKKVYKERKEKSSK